jgi:hypothetical protein
VYEATKKSGDYCSTYLATLSTYLDATIKDKETTTKAEYAIIEKVFDLKAIGVSDDEFSEYIADIFSTAVQKGKRVEFCNIVTTIEPLTEEEQLNALKDFGVTFGVLI